MKKIMFCMMSLVVAFWFCVGCGSNDSSNTGKVNDNNDNKEEKVLKIFQFKVEIAEELEELARLYEAEHEGVTIEIETAGGGVDYGAMLKSRFASAQYPDIFNNGGDNELILWKEQLMDLSDQPWVERMLEGTKDSISLDGKIYGMPLTVEGFGILYNKDLFEKAGITKVPSTLDELEEACQKLEVIDVTPFSNGHQEWWVLGHNFDNMIGLQDKPFDVVEDLKAGTLKLKDNEIANRWVMFLDIMKKYGQPTPLTIDYNTQVTEFAIEKCAMMKQGNWTQNQISEINPDIKVGLMPIPLKEEGNDSIAVGVPNNWVIYKDSPVADIAKDFLNYMVSTDTGKEYLVSKFRFIPAFSEIPYSAEDLGDIATQIGDYIQKGKTVPWTWHRFPDGSINEVGACLQAYIGSQMTKDELFEGIESNIHELTTKE